MDQDCSGYSIVTAPANFDGSDNSIGTLSRDPNTNYATVMNPEEHSQVIRLKLATVVKLIPNGNSPSSELRYPKRVVAI